MGPKLCALFLPSSECFVYAPEDICVLVRAGATAAAVVLRPYLATYGIVTRAQDALQDLLAEPLTSVVVDVMAGLPLIEGSLIPDS